MNLKHLVNLINDSQSINHSALIELAEKAGKGLMKNLMTVEPKDFDVIGEKVHKGNVIITKEEFGNKEVLFDLAEYRLMNHLASTEFNLILIDGHTDLDDLDKARFYLRTLIIVEKEEKVREQLVRAFEDVMVEMFETKAEEYKAQ